MPHMLGYGSTSKPSKATRYSSKSICADIAALLDHLRLDKAVVVGHDWGAAVAWRFGLYYPQRLVALITCVFHRMQLPGQRMTMASMSVPYFPPSSQYRPPQQVSKLVPSFAYQEYFASTEATREIEANVRSPFSPRFILSTQPDSWISSLELYSNPLKIMEGTSLFRYLKKEK